jgi:hypothetical protein
MKAHATILVAVLALGGVTGCASLPATAPAQNRPVIDADPAIVADALETMVKVFPPALTPLVVRQTDAGAFGHSLLDGLRERGYAVIERDGAGDKSSRAKAVLGAPFTYRLAPIAGTGMYELVLTVGDNKLSRLYILNVTDSRIYPGGAWSRRE